MRHELGCLGDHRAVHIANLKSFGPHAPRRLGQQHTRVGALERQVGVGKMRANVAQRRSAQQGVGDGVQQHIGVRVAQQPEVKRNLYPTQNQLALSHERMDVPAFAYSEIHGFTY